MSEKTPWNPSRTATARVRNVLPWPERCNICESDVECVGNEEIYGMPYGEWPWCFRCKFCEAYVGLHPFTAIPLGTLADDKTRRARKEAQKIFRPMWSRDGMSRKDAHAYLADLMEIPVEHAHISWFSFDECERAIALMQRGFK